MWDRKLYVRVKLQFSDNTLYKIYNLLKLFLNNLQKFMF